MIPNLLHEDPEMARLVAREHARQTEVIELIASENVVSPAVQEAMGTILTNKYAEGYPGNRYYGGCHVVDQIETLARDRAKALFGCEYANVQPHSGSQANQAVFLALLKPGDTILSLSLNAGGHLTHGSPVNLSGKWFHVVHYGVDQHTGFIPMDQVAQLAQTHKPKLIIAGASAYPRFIDFEGFRAIADGVGAFFLVDMAHIAGLVAGGVHPSPLPHAHVVTSTTHKTLRGPRGGIILAQTEALGQKLNSAIFPGLQGGPLMHVIAAKGVSFLEASRPAFKDYSLRIVRNARALAESLLESGFSLVTGGTDNHLVLVDLQKKDLTGAAAERRLEDVGLVCNKNSVPFDPRPPKETSGIRLGTPAMTTRGLKEEDFRQIGRWIGTVLSQEVQDADLKSIQQDIRSLCSRYPG